MLQKAEECRRAQEEERLSVDQDLDTRRMELEAQRRRLEQVNPFRLPASHPAFSTGQIPSHHPCLLIPLFTFFWKVKPFYI